MADSSTTTALNQLDRLETEFLAREADRPRIGYLCLRLPRELIEASGAIPVRIIAEPSTTQAGSYLIRTDACSFCRSIPASLSAERYAGLRAIIAGSCCDQMRRLMDTLATSLDIPVILYGAPRTWGLDKRYYFGEMRRAFQRLSEILSRKEDTNALLNLIESRDTLCQKITLMREEGCLPTPLLHRIAASSLPSVKLMEFLSELPLSPAASICRIRLLLMGSIPSGRELAIIEEVGGEVVADATCLGDRAFHCGASQAANPLEILYDQIVEGNLCPHRRPNTALTDYVRGLIALRRVEGMVYRSVKYCHPFGLSALRFKEELGLPFLQLDDDLTLPALSSFRTRIGAFVEMLTMKRHAHP